VALGRAQVLPDGEDLDALLAQLPERLDDLSCVSPRPTISPDLVTTSSPPISLALRRTRSERSQREPRRADRIQARHDLDVVVEDVGALGDHARQRHLLAAEVGREHLDLAAGRLQADRADHADERPAP
jgi:hypothetical protein